MMRTNTRRFPILLALVAAAVVPVVTGAWNAWAQSKNVPAIARVGPLEVPRDEYEDRARRTLETYRTRTGEKAPEALAPMLERHALETVIRSYLLMLEAKRTGKLVGDADAEAEFKRNVFFNPGGKFDAQRYAGSRAGNPAEFSRGLEDARLRVSALRMHQQLERDLLPAAGPIKHALLRELTSATLDVLPLPFSDFAPAELEPSDAEVLAHYRANTKSYLRPARATLTALVVTADADEASSPRDQDDVLHAHADSILALCVAGARLETLGALGTLHRNVEVLPGNFPGFLRADERVQSRIMDTEGDTMFPEVVRARSGWAIVRVDASAEERPAPLSEVAPAIRGELRAAAMAREEDKVLRSLYRSMGDSLRRPAARMRYAMFDGATLEPQEPNAATLEQYYRSRLADYSTFDPERGAVEPKPFELVVNDVRQRWRAEEQVRMARAAAEQVASAWQRGKRDRKAEALAFRMAGPIDVLLGAPVDSSRAGAVLGDTLRMRDGGLGVGAFPLPGGMVVFEVESRDANYLPGFDVIRPVLAERRTRHLENEALDGARALYDADPSRFATGRTIHMGRILVPMIDIMNVPLTREEVERWHREHLTDYSAPEVVAARHILVAPSGPGAAADQAARVKAEGIMRRVRAGEDFGDLAREFSDDGRTRASGGDLGSIGRGLLIPEFEREVFSMRPGDLKGPIRTPLGWHLIRCTAYEPLSAPPLAHVYANVGADAAREKAVRLTQARAESIFREVRTPADGARVARELQSSILRNTRIAGDMRNAGDLIPYFRTLDTMKPGEVYPGVQRLRGQGFVITWIDSITPPRAPEWHEAVEMALAAYRATPGRSGADARRAELESLAARGWSLDSLAALYGGLQRLEEVRAGDPLPGLGGAQLLDSLVFGRDGVPPVLAPGQTSGWIEFPDGLARIRVIERLTPDPAQVTARVERERRRALDRELFFHFAELKRRYPVRILDPELALVSLPPPEAPAASR